MATSRASYLSPPLHGTRSIPLKILVNDIKLSGTLQNIVNPKIKEIIGTLDNIKQSSETSDTGQSTVPCYDMTPLYTKRATLRRYLLLLELKLHQPINDLWLPQHKDVNLALIRQNSPLLFGAFTQGK